MLLPAVTSSICYLQLNAAARAQQPVPGGERTVVCRAQQSWESRGDSAAGNKTRGVFSQ